MNSIALESEYGSGGSEIGQLISAKLNVPYYDGKALIKAAKEFHFPMTLLENYATEDADNILCYLAVIAKQPNAENTSKIDEVFQAIQKTIKILNKQQAAVFVGHYASTLLHSRDIKTVFVYASDSNDRIKRITQRETVSKEQAITIMNQADYYKFWTKECCFDWKRYDIALNTSKISIERCVEILIREMNEGLRLK